MPDQVDLYLCKRDIANILLPGIAEPKKRPVEFSGAVLHSHTGNWAVAYLAIDQGRPWRDVAGNRGVVDLTISRLKVGRWRIEYSDQSQPHPALPHLVRPDIDDLAKDLVNEPGAAPCAF